MKPIQFILIAMLFAMAMVVWLNRRQAKLINRFIVLAFVVVGTFMVLSPDTTTRIAEWFGVGRGTDLLLYLAIIGFAFVSVLLYARLRELEYALTVVVRTLAILDGRAPQRDDDATHPASDAS